MTTRLILTLFLGLALGLLSCKRDEPCYPNQCYSVSINHMGDHDSLISRYDSQMEFSNDTKTGTVYANGDAFSTTKIYPYECPYQPECVPEMTTYETDVSSTSFGRVFSSTAFTTPYQNPNGHTIADGWSGVSYYTARHYNSKMATSEDRIHVSLNSTSGEFATGESLWFIWNPNNPPTLDSMVVEGTVYYDVYLINEPSYAIHPQLYEDDGRFLLDAHDLYIAKELGIIQFRVGTELYQRN